LLTARMFFFPSSFLTSLSLLQLPLEMQSKVASYMKLDAQSDSEHTGIRNTKGKYQILPTNDDEAMSLTGFPPASAVTHQGLGNEQSMSALERFINQSRHQISTRTAS
jgi:hypothetical protein